ncbi:MAG: uracil-DNA glycosylase [Ruminococcus sp.]|nr:uracil-DNA glycosylase [Ruminococcus sp.]
MVHIGNSWDEILGDEFKKDYYLQLRKFLKREYAHYHVYPDMYDIFNALKFTPYENVKAVIIGQDPYHEPGQAHGLCFSVKKGVPLPPSLQNIYKELHDDVGCTIPQSGDLTEWAKQGVLLLNTSLTVREGQANSHSGKGWEILTDEVIRKLNNADRPIAFILWGSNARSKASLITNPLHRTFQSPHPSPLSAYRGFFGCRHFSKVNSFLSANGIEPINWQISD